MGMPGLIFGKVDKLSLKTVAQIYKSQSHYSTAFYNCVLYLTFMVLKTPDTKKGHIAAAATKDYGTTFKNRDDTDQYLPLAKYTESVSKTLSNKQKEWLWRDHKKDKANEDNILVAKKTRGQPTTKQARRTASAVESHCSQINNQYAQNQKMMAVLVTSGIDIHKSNPSSDKDIGNDHKMAANKKNSDLKKAKKKRFSEGLGSPRGNSITCPTTMLLSFQFTQSNLLVVRVIIVEY